MSALRRLAAWGYLRAPVWLATRLGGLADVWPGGDAIERAYNREAVRRTRRLNRHSRAVLPRRAK